MRIVFMGTPDFAVPCLKAVLKDGHEVLAVYTQPDKPKGRGYAMLPPPVKVVAEEAGIPVFQPATLRTAEAAEALRALKPDLMVVVAYGKILPREVLEIPPKGCVNVHGSLLPRYRGAAPIQWAVLNGDKTTGVATMKMAEGLDTGDILLMEETPIGENETAGELYDRLSDLGARLLSRTLSEFDEIVPQPQGEMTTAYASMLDKSMSPVDWTKPAAEIHHQIQGLNPWPAASTQFEGKPLKLWRSQIAENRPGTPGQVCEHFVVCCGGGTALRLLEVQPAGKKAMEAADFLRGHPAKEGTTLPF